MTNEWETIELTDEQRERANRIAKRLQAEAILLGEEGTDRDAMQRGIAQFVTGEIARLFGPNATPGWFHAQGEFVKGLLGPRN